MGSELFSQEIVLTRLPSPFAFPAGNCLVQTPKRTPDLCVTTRAEGRAMPSDGPFVYSSGFLALNSVSDTISIASRFLQ